MDLGQAADYSALSITERVPRPTGSYLLSGDEQLVADRVGAVPLWRPVVVPEIETIKQVRWLERFPIGTSYTVVVAEVLNRIERLLVTLEPTAANPVLIVDHTGVGRPVVDLFRQKQVPIPLVAISITSGQTANVSTTNPGEVTVPKKDLIAPLLIAVQNDLFRIAPELDLAKAFAAEMQAFRMKVTARGGESYEAWRESDHDDLVLSVALGCWAADQIDRQVVDIK